MPKAQGLTRRKALISLVIAACLVHFPKTFHLNNVAGADLAADPHIQYLTKIVNK